MSEALEQVALLLEDGQCLPECDSIAHEDMCPIANPGNVVRALGDRLVEPLERGRLGARVPGIMALHAIITKQCRLNRTDEGAVDEALARIKSEYVKLMESWPVEGKPVQFHVALTVEYKR